MAGTDTIATRIFNGRSVIGVDTAIFICKDLARAIAMNTDILEK
ncbi:MAG: hypothetical protein AAGF75_01480 [Cyanobacteria bacterium P01_H01_bin.130]